MDTRRGPNHAAVAKAEFPGGFVMGLEAEVTRELLALGILHAHHEIAEVGRVDAGRLVLLKGCKHGSRRSEGGRSKKQRREKQANSADAEPNPGIKRCGARR